MAVVLKGGALSRGQSPRDDTAPAHEPPPTISADLPERSEAALAQESHAPLRSQLQILAVLRGVGIVTQLCAIWLLSYGFDVIVPLPQFLGGVSLLVLANAMLVYRLSLPWRVSQREYFGHLMADFIWLTHALYWSGGSASNPFADMYIVLIGMAALALSWRYTAAMVMLAAVAYTVLVVHHEPLHFSHMALNRGDAEDVAHGLHFVLVAGIVGYFGYRFAIINRRYGEAIASARERDVQRESAVNLATLAAGTAHEMGTPLTTMAVIVNDMRRSEQPPTDFKASLDMIWGAIQACKRSLGDMVVAVGADHMPERTKKAAPQFVEEVVDRFCEMRPDVPVTTTLICAENSKILTGCSLRQALVNLVSNAADASPEGIEVVLRCAQDDVAIEVLDRGPGIPPEVRDKLGRIIYTSKPGMKGNGLGVFLASKTIERMGGRLEFSVRDGGGTCARVMLPTIDAAATAWR